MNKIVTRISVARKVSDFDMRKSKHNSDKKWVMQTVADADLGLDEVCVPLYFPRRRSPHQVPSNERWGCRTSLPPFSVSPRARMRLTMTASHKRSRNCGNSSRRFFLR